MWSNWMKAVPSMPITIRTQEAVNRFSLARVLGPSNLKPPHCRKVIMPSPYWRLPITVNAMDSAMAAKNRVVNICGVGD